MKVTKTDGAKRVGIWIRVSTEDQVKGESPEHHESRARHYAEAKGWNVIEVYRLDALSGKTVKDYPATRRMVEDIRTKHITGLIFSKLARLARNTKELLEFADMFRDHDADLISLAESIDTSTPAGRLFYTMIAAMAQWEREEIAERVAASVPVRARMGKSLGGQAPFGYQWKDGKLLIAPEEAPVRKLLYELFREHCRKKTVARLLNERGYRTRNGSAFSDTTVDRLLRDPTAKGIRRANYTLSTDSKKAWRLKPESEWVLHEVEAIIDEALWAECNGILDATRAKGKRKTRETNHLFAGLAYCHCGRKMYVPSNTPKYVCYGCRNKIPAEDLEAIFHEELKRFFFSPEEIALHLEESSATTQAKEELLKTLEREAKKLQAESDKLYDLYQSGMIDKEGFGAKYRPLSARQKQLADEIPAVQAEIDILKISHLSQAEIVAEARDLYTRWPDLPYQERRRVVETITERIVIGESEVEIDLFYAPPSTPQGGGGGPQSDGSEPVDPDTPTSPIAHGNRATEPHGRVAFLPYVKMNRKVSRERVAPPPTTVGEHIRKVRCDRGLTQARAAALMAVSAATVLNWEKGATEPPTAFWPAIIAFLGYDPHPTPMTLSERMSAFRRRKGLSIKDAAREAGVYEGTWAEWEHAGHIPWKRYRLFMERFLATTVCGAQAVPATLP